MDNLDSGWTVPSFANVPGHKPCGQKQTFRHRPTPAHCYRIDNKRFIPPTAHPVKRTTYLLRRFTSKGVLYARPRSPPAQSVQKTSPDADLVSRDLPSPSHALTTVRQSIMKNASTTTEAKERPGDDLKTLRTPVTRVSEEKQKEARLESAEKAGIINPRESEGTFSKATFRARVPPYRNPR